LFSLTEFAKFNASNLPINQRVNKKVLDSVLSEELKLQSIDSKFGYGILDKNNKLTSISNNTFLDQKDKKIIRIRFLLIKMTRRFLLFHWFSQKRCFFG
jgi:hypothetical protein